VAKLLAHNYVLYSATQKHMSGKDVLCRLLDAMAVWTDAFSSRWCKKSHIRDGHMLESVFPVAHYRKVLAQR